MKEGKQKNLKYNNNVDLNKVGFLKGLKRKVKNKFKLKKKWRFWRVFKRYFLRSKKKRFFTKTRWLFFQRQIVWRQLVKRYGKHLKRKALRFHFRDFSGCFFKLLVYLELRLDIFILTLNLVARKSSLTKVNELILKKKILVNFGLKKRNYFVKPYDLLQLIDYKFRKAFYKYVRYRWRKFTWHRWRDSRWQCFRLGMLKRKLKKQFRKRAISRSFVEIFVRFLSATVLRYPFWGEIMVLQRRLYLSRLFLRRVFFLF